MGDSATTSVPRVVTAMYAVIEWGDSAVFTPVAAFSTREAAEREAALNPARRRVVEFPIAWV